MKPTHPTVSRDTRVLFTIVVISIATLWVLARIRFPDRLSTPNPVPPLLAQLTPPSALARLTPPSFDDISAAMAELETRLQPSIVGVDVERRRGAADFRPIRTTVSALRFRDDLAVALIDVASGADWSEPTIVGVVEVARDPASQFAVLRVPGGDAPALSIWTPRRPSSPGFLIAADLSTAGASLRPTFVGSLREVVTPLWSDPIWALPDQLNLAAGTFVFTVDGVLAGLVVELEGRRALVPAATVVGIAERLARESHRRPGRLGIEVQPLSAALAAATGARAGVVITWLDPQGPGARELRVTDVVDGINGMPMPTLEHWTARVAHLTEGETVVVSVWRGGNVRDVRLTASAPTERKERPLGLTLRTVPRVGVEIVSVDTGSAALWAGLRIGDLLTVVGDIERPTAPQASRVFATASLERPITIAVTRAGTHHVFALERSW
jgi:hypothetical protein